MRKQDKRHKAKVPAPEHSNRPTAYVNGVAMSIPQPLTIRQESTAEDNERYEEEKRERAEQLVVSKKLLKASRNLNLITVLGGIVSLIGLCGLLYSISLNIEATKDATRSADATISQFHIDQRPWIKIQFLDNLQAPNPTITSQIPTPLEGHVARIPYRLSNVGKTFAEGVRVEGSVVIISSANQVPVYMLDPARRTLDVIVQHIGIFPNDNSIPDVIVRTDKMGHLMPTTHDEIEGLNNGAYYIAVFGIIHYDDIFGIHHWTKFCQATGAPIYGTSYNTRSCMDANSVDAGS